MIKTLTAPFRLALRFPLVQFGIVVALILLLQSADDSSVYGLAYGALDRVVDRTVALTANVFTVKSFTKSWLTFGFMIAYVYMACWLIMMLLGGLIRILLDLAGRTNLLWLRNVIARQRGIVAYRAWLPLERIRPENVAQRDWEERFAWPANNKPPYQPLGRRLLTATAGYAGLLLVIVVLLQTFSPFPALSWLQAVARRWID